ncbi:MAG TPA: HAD family hydrolase [Chloroflexota bacterium]|nr:HAD family hydrolase [Chloroflexota bacterium]
MTESSRVVFLLDVDNTLLDNDRLKEDLGDRIEQLEGTAREKMFWRIYDDMREEEGYVDIPGSVDRLAAVTHDPSAGEELRAMLETWPYRDYVYPGAFETIAHLRTLGTVAILSDGDPVFQPMKIRDSGLADAVQGNVMICVHKEQELPRVFSTYPGDHYVMVDDKPRILATLAQECPHRFTTVLVRQGKYASHVCDYQPAPDIIVDHIGDLFRFTLDDLRI